MELANIDYNYIRTRLKRLEEVYKQSVDKNVRNTVKEQTLYDISQREEWFYQKYSDMFNNCDMSSLKQIGDLVDAILSDLSVTRLPTLDIEEAKKMLKLNDRLLNGFVKEYNAAVEKENLSYFSSKIDQKFVILTYDKGEFIGSITNSLKIKKTTESLCCFCKKFKRGDDILFVSNVKKPSKDQYSTIGQYCCSDYKKCNENIEDTTALNDFLSYSKTKARKK